VGDGEFSFTVSHNGEILKDSNGKDLTFTTQAGGLAEVTIPIDQNDLGTQRYVISEVIPAEAVDKVLNSVSYTASSVIAKATIAEVSGGKVEATSITYTATKKDSDGIPLMVNEYRASGSLTLTGNKILKQNSTGQDLTVSANEFNFVVKEGNTIVATGTTLDGGEIQFTPINYIQTDIGEHQYTISEKVGDQLFVEYTAPAVNVTVNVKDNGDGTLTAEATYPDGGVTFTNGSTYVTPTGVKLEVLPYALVAAVAVAGFGACQVTRKGKNDDKRR
jgi:pilin isopeptide linkage protein